MFLLRSISLPVRVKFTNMLEVLGPNRNQLAQKCLYSNTNTSPVPNKRLTVELLKDRNVVRVHGDEVIPFLQGLVTNDMNHLSVGSSTTIGAQSLYTMFLNKSGRVLYDCIIYRSGDPKTMYIECDAKITQELCKHLQVYRVRRNIQIDKSDEYLPWIAYHPEEAISISKVNKKYVSPSMILAKDPRVPHIGIRMLLNTNIKWAEANLLFQNENDPNVLTATKSYNYRIHRYRLGVGEGVLDLPPGKCFPLEANCDFLHGVSFHKGCYVGQELTARVHHTGTIRKRLMPVKLTRPINPLMYEQDPVKIFNTKGELVGTMRGSAADYALALVRLERVENAGCNVDGQPCEIIKPSWWPAEAPKRLREMSGA